MQGEDGQKNWHSYVTLMKISIIGCGYVGEQVAFELESVLTNKIVRIDPALNSNTIEQNTDSDAWVLCLPTPTVLGVCDDSLIAEAYDNIQQYNTPILIKSTILPKQIIKYKECTYSPEFISEINPTTNNNFPLILAGQDIEFWKDVYTKVNVWTESLFPKEFFVTDLATASIIKYVHNCWLATKVAFFHDLYNKCGDEYNHDKLIEGLSFFDTIGSTHMNVPNSDGGLGFGGKCFPKDTEAFSNAYNLPILDSVIKTNKRLRS
jgi:UDP-glucose 6-dehydrogenase